MNDTYYAIHIPNYGFAYGTFRSTKAECDRLLAYRQQIGDAAKGEEVREATSDDYRRAAVKAGSLGGVS